MFTPEIRTILDSAKGRFGVHECNPGLSARQQQAWCELLDQLREEIVSTVESNPKWVFWITSNRGDIAVFGDYDEWVDLGEVRSRDEFKNLWLEYFPHETTWYEVTIQLDKNNLQIILERWFCIIDLNEGGVSCNGTDWTLELLSWILEAVRAVVNRFLKAPEEYNCFIDQHLPYYCRLGRIKRSVLWDHRIGERFDKELGEEDILLLEKTQPSSVENLPTMTASMFFRFCEICYTANDYFGDDESLSAREKYRKMADGRHGGLLDLPEDDPLVFATWFDRSESLGAHPWEICRGGNSTHISLYPTRQPTNKWQLQLSGFSMSRALETAKMAIALHDANVPFKLEKAREMLKMLQGEDYVGVVPVDVTPVYCHGLFPEKDIFFFINPWHEKEVANIVSRNAEWYEIPLLKKR